MSYLACVFLDTTFTYQDPFFRKVSSRRILDLAHKSPDVIIVMSRVVYGETRAKIAKKLASAKSKMQSELKSVSDLFPNDEYFHDEQITSLFDVDELLHQYEQFVEEHIANGTFAVIDAPEGIMSELVHRAIHRIKPFTENKDEFRDAITWLSYVAFAQNLEPYARCYFVTNNTKDFFDDTQTTLHPRLAEDSTRFTMYRTVKELFDKEHEHLGNIESTAIAGAIFEWAMSNLNEKWVYTILRGPLKESLSEQISLGITQAVSEQDQRKFPVELLPTSFSVDLISVHELQVTQSNSDVFVEGIVVFSAKGIPQLYSDPIFIQTAAAIDGTIEFAFRVIEKDHFSSLEIQQFRSLSSPRFEDKREMPRCIECGRPTRELIRGCCLRCNAILAEDT